MAALQPVQDSAFLSALLADLHDGEAQAIALCREIEGRAVLIDEKKGRLVAQRLGIRPLGVLGILVLAKRDGLIESVRPLLDDLISTADFRIGQQLYQRVLADVHE